MGRRSDRGRGGVERIEYRALKKGALNEKAHGRTDEKLGAVKRGVVAWGDDDVGASLGGHEPLVLLQTTRAQRSRDRDRNRDNDKGSHITEETATATTTHDVRNRGAAATVATLTTLMTARPSPRLGISTREDNRRRQPEQSVRRETDLGA